MATLTVQIVSANGTTNRTLTFSGPDAARIMAGYQASKPGGGSATQQDLTNDLSSMLKDYLRDLVLRKETVYPNPPDLT